MIPPMTFEKIKERLLVIEKVHDVEILYAVESGSRAWGFESLDSDFDVRFIYKHPEQFYLSILPKRDVIEIPIQDDLDFSGWDLKKAFFLLNKSNPVLFEWMRSPIIYRKNPEFFEVFTTVSRDYFSPIRSMYHYLHMAKHNFRDYLKRDSVKAKKYFYVLRPLLACLWIEKFESAPPLEFQILVEELLTDSMIREELEILLNLKKSGRELGEIPRKENLNNFIEITIQHLEASLHEFDAKNMPDESKLDLAFQRILRLPPYFT